MDSSIAAALITTIGSIVVALIGKLASGSDQQTGKVISIRYKGSKTWAVAIVASGLWIFISVEVVYAAGAVNWFLIAIVTAVLSVVAPIRPMYAASLVLMLYSANFLMFHVHQLLHGERLYVSPDYFVVLRGALLAGFGNALAAGLLCRWRGRLNQRVTETSLAERSKQNVNTKAESLGHELSELAKLHESGALTDEEFRKAKERIIGA